MKIKKKKQIVETENGFKTLAQNLQKWINDQLELVEK